MNAKKLILIPAAVLLAAVSLAQAQYGTGGGTHTSPKVLKFTTMVGVGGFLLSPSDVRGVVGDDLPWVAKSIKGDLSANGLLSIKIRGLVFPDAPSVPPELRGTNDEVAADSFLAPPARIARAVLSLVDRIGEKTGPGLYTMSQVVSQRDIGAMAGVARETVSRTLSEWQRRGVVRREPGRRNLTVRKSELECESTRCPGGSASPTKPN